MSETEAQAERPARERRRRSLKESLGSIVLGFEVIVVALAALAIFGLKALDPALALGGGALLIVIIVITLGLLRFSWGQYVGWGIQLVIIASGFFTAAMFFVGVLFVALWTYCMITADRIDRQNRARAQAVAESEGAPS